MEEAEEETVRNRHMEKKWLAELLLNYARRHQEEVEVLFDLSTAFALDIGKNDDIAQYRCIYPSVFPLALYVFFLFPRSRRFQLPERFHVPGVPS